jgi:hypothetical protein
MPPRPCTLHTARARHCFLKSSPLTWPASHTAPHAAQPHCGRHKACTTAGLARPPPLSLWARMVSQVLTCKHHITTAGLARPPPYDTPQRVGLGARLVRHGWARRGGRHGAELHGRGQRGLGRAAAQLRARPLRLGRALQQRARAAGVRCGGGGACAGGRERGQGHAWGCGARGWGCRGGGWWRHGCTEAAEPGRRHLAQWDGRGACASPRAAPRGPWAPP